MLRIAPTNPRTMKGKSTEDLRLQSVKTAGPFLTLPLVLSLKKTREFGGDVYHAIVYLVPTVLRMNLSGISFKKANMASNPVQCVGTMYSGFIALMPATVF